MENITGMFCYSLTSLDSLAQYPDHSLARRNQPAAHQSLASLSACSSINSSAQPTLVFFFSQHWISCTSSWKPIASAKKLRCLHPATDGRRHGSLILLSSAAHHHCYHCRQTPKALSSAPPHLVAEDGFPRAAEDKRESAAADVSSPGRPRSKAN